MGASVRPETLDQKIARLEREQSGATAETLDQKIARMESAQGSASTGASSVAPETTGEKIAGALSAAYQGLTLGAGNKITAAVRALTKPWWMADTTFPEEFAKSNQILDQFRQNHPVASTALEVAGGLPWMGVGGSATAAPTLLGRIGQLAKTGAAYGAASGGLSANKLSDVAPGAVTGGVAGAITAPIIGGLFGAYRGTTGPEARANQMLTQGLLSGGIEPTAVRIPANEPTTIMDLGSSGPMRTARAARNTAGSNAAGTIDEMLTARAQEAGPRIQQALAETTGIPRQDFNLTVEQLSAAKKANADPLYAKAREAAPLSISAKASEDGPTLGDILKRPSMQKAQDYADALAAERGQPPQATTVFQALGLKTPAEVAAFKAKNPAFANMNTGEVPYETLHNYKVRLDELLGYARANGELPDKTPATKGMLRAIQDTKHDLLGIMDTHNAAYKQARAQFAGDAAMQDAYEAGRSFFQSSRTASEGARELADLSPSEQEMWRRGGMTWLQEKVQKLSANPDLPAASRKVNIVQRILGGSEDGAKAKMLFGDQKSYDTFLAKMAPEAVYPKTAAGLLNQSSTAAQIAEGRGLGPMDAYYAMGAARGRPWSIAHMVARLANGGKMSPAVADAVAERVTKQGGDLNAYLQTLGPTDLKGLLAARAAGVISGKGWGLLAGQR